MNDKQSYVYILASQKHGTLYIGVTANLIKRVYEHKQDLVEGFTKRHRVHHLIYFEVYEDIRVAILDSCLRRNDDMARNRPRYRSPSLRGVACLREAEAASLWRRQVVKDSSGQIARVSNRLPFSPSFFINGAVFLTYV